MNETVIERAKKIKLLLMDCDGVLTDGRLYYTENGETMKVFHVHDGQGIVLWHKLGFESGIISGRNSKIVGNRAKELGIHYLYQGIHDKVSIFNEIINKIGINAEEVAYIGDDIPDIGVFNKIGLAVAVADAIGEVKEKSHFITENNGGNGAVRELIDLLIAAK